MTTAPAWFSEVLSPARFAPYVALTGGDIESARRLYAWNVEVSEAFYSPLHWFEVALRNSMHRSLASKWGRLDWWEAAPVNKVGRGLVDRACRKVIAPKRVRTPDDVVAQLNLGFWVGLLSTDYDRTMWVPCLHKAFPHYRGPRSVLHGELDTLRLLRNRIMHHEPIHHRHLEADHRSLLQVISYLSADLTTELASQDRISGLLAVRPGSVS